MSRVYNFSAGPAVLPLEVLQQAQEDLVDYKGTGMSVMEMSHRGKDYSPIHDEAIATFKELAGIGDDWSVLFIQGGGSQQFAMVPMNFLGAGQSADYVNSGTWGGKALKEAQVVASLRGATVNTVANCAKDIPARMPTADEIKWTEGAAYAHICTNETISGAQFKTIPTPAAGVPLIGDMSSDILSCERDYNKFDMFYAGAQKNLGPSGMAVVAIKKEFAAKGAATLPTLLKYSTHLDNNSLYNTPPTWAIYIFGLVMKWVKKQGKENLFKLNREKAAKIYSVIDSTGFYRGTALPEFRSDMNVTFRLPTEELEAQFVAEAKKLGMSSLKGHRSVGGIRATIYNAFPMEGVDALVSFMKDFEKKNG
ncbi:MAG: 3-phosphoserine/phosphohydroxythreonine transaminase [Kiritimatiellae bacterium]|nr:3-phosphoserine/phosphohydroxythreonine transaminase [Kiritimatiellia bacterium]